MRIEFKGEVKVRASATVSVSGTPKDHQRTRMDGEAQSLGVLSLRRANTENGWVVFIPPDA